MNIWSGGINLNDQSHLKGLRLIDPTSHWQSDLATDSTLHFRSFVNPVLIPLYAHSGPNLELHTADAGTAEWLKAKLLGNLWLEDEEFEKFQAVQCPVGVLVGVEGVKGKVGSASGSGATTTDLLVHGVLSGTSFGRPPTPPSAENEPPGTGLELRIYASPISAGVITRAQAYPTTPPNTDTLAGGDADADADAHFAEFLPDLRSPSPKRKRVTSLFESVAEHHKRVRQKGGEAVSQLMAPTHSQASQQLQNFSRIKRESEEPSLPALERIASQRARSVSIGGKPLERLVSNRGSMRGLVSRKNTPTPFLDLKRELSPALFPDTKQHDPSTMPRDIETVIAENKHTITRTILTCMRLYGFSRPSTKAGKHAEEAPDEKPLAADNASTEEDEFKAMYHATYRASTFALRKYLRESATSTDNEGKTGPPLLEKQKAMGYIDEFLRLFCEDRD